MPQRKTGFLEKYPVVDGHAQHFLNIKSVMRRQISGLE